MGKDFSPDVFVHLQVKESDCMGLSARKSGEVMLGYASQKGEMFKRVGEMTRR